MPYITNHQTIMIPTLTKQKSIRGRLFSSLFTLITMIILTGCPLFEEEEMNGACETSIINFNGDQIYKCENDQENDRCDRNDAEISDRFWEGKTCINLGYFFDGGFSGWRYDEQNNVKPGAYGAWGDGSASGTEADANNSGGSCGEDDYDGPEFDIQIDSQCKAAFVYRCSGADEAADVACQLYQVYRDQDSSIPVCPYCN